MTYFPLLRVWSRRRGKLATATFSMLELVVGSVGRNMKRQLAVKWRVKAQRREGRDAAAKCHAAVAASEQRKFCSLCGWPASQRLKRALPRPASPFFGLPSFLRSPARSPSSFISLEIHGRWSFCPTVPDDELSRSSSSVERGRGSLARSPAQRPKSRL